MRFKTLPGIILLKNFASDPLLSEITPLCSFIETLVERDNYRAYFCNERVKRDDLFTNFDCVVFFAVGPQRRVGRKYRRKACPWSSRTDLEEFPATTFQTISESMTKTARKLLNILLHNDILRLLPFSFLELGWPLEEVHPFERSSSEQKQDTIEFTLVCTRRYTYLRMFSSFFFFVHCENETRELTKKTRKYVIRVYKRFIHPWRSCNCHSFADVHCYRRVPKRFRLKSYLLIIPSFLNKIFILKTCWKKEYFWNLRNFYPK